MQIPGLYLLNPVSDSRDVHNDEFEGSRTTNVGPLENLALNLNLNPLPLRHDTPADQDLGPSEISSPSVAVPGSPEKRMSILTMETGFSLILDPLDVILARPMPLESDHETGDSAGSSDIDRLFTQIFLLTQKCDL
jgi:hypothetical protein